MVFFPPLGELPVISVDSSLVKVFGINLLKSVKDTLCLDQSGTKSILKSIGCG